MGNIIIIISVLESAVLMHSLVVWPKGLDFPANLILLASVDFCWRAFWVFALGYMISTLTQGLLTRERVQSTTGNAGPKSVAFGAF
jgi:hypothetical protein